MRISAPTHYYVWYRVIGDVDTALPAIEAMLTDVTTATGVVARLRARRDEPRTWMEIYENVADAAAFEPALAACVAKHEAASWAEGGTRHTEAFVAVR
jgi:hypothetical protein